MSIRAGVRRSAAALAVIACLRARRGLRTDSSGAASGGNDAADAPGHAHRRGLLAREAARERGAITFEITNGGTAKVTELELKNEDGIILGERENIVSGIDGSFTLNLQPGRYVLSCPNGDKEDNGVLVVTGKATPARANAAAPLLKKATAGYRAYVVAAERQAARRHDSTSSRRSEAATSPAPRSSSGPPGSTTRRSSRSPRASATSTRRSTRASTTSTIPRHGPASTASSRSSGSRDTTTGTGPLRRRSCSPT